MMLSCRAILFDLDGTLVDSYGAIATALNHTRRHFSLEPLALREVKSMVGHGLAQLIESNLGAARRDEGMVLFEEAYERCYRQATSALPGMPDVLLELQRRGISLAIASNKPPRFSLGLVAHLGLDLPPSQVLGPGPDIPPKPHPKMLWLALESLGVTASEAIYVGDMALDVESARSAGLRCVLVPTGSVPLEILEMAGADAVVSSLEGLLTLVKKD